MRGIKSILIVAIPFWLVSASLSAREYLGVITKSTKATIQSKTEPCSPAQAQFEFAVNNVRTAAETAGNTWYDRGNALPFYEIPEGGGNHAIFAGALWMGGTDPAGNLKLAAIRFRQVGNDFWPGPLTDDGAATTFDETCEQYDRFFNMSRQDVELHRFFYTLLNQGIDPSTDPLFENGYTIPTEILEWPAHGNTALGQSFNLAPFADLRDPETGQILTTPNLYEPEQGDYPLYDLEAEIDCRTRLVTDPVPLFGDFSMYWIFNDKGNIHTESQGEPIGMEIQAQMFGFTTNDEINNMTFCNYVLINRGSLTLEETFFAQWVDTDLGNPVDDYVGCDVQRGLGYSYNGSNFDGSSGSGPGYGDQPPAIGIDFFEGPFQDPDGINNSVGIGENEALNGLGYFDIIDTLTVLGPDSVIDNERFGMRRFVYHQNNDPNQAINGPSIAVEYYQMMRGIWRDETPMTFGGLGYDELGVDPVTDFMFPGESDPLHWGTGGIDPQYGIPGGWTEENEGNPSGDRRFLQSAGPFTLDPGEFNNITVGAVFARAATGGPFASVNSLFVADDKAQALFENCFRLLSGPNAPDLTFQELDKELIFYLRNTNQLSNNRGEQYIELDPTIPEINENGELLDRFYRFQGYQVYQLRDDEVSTSDLENPELARLAFQVDIEDFDDAGQPVGQLINYEFDEQLGLSVPVEKVNGQNAGISHSFRVTTDLFAQGGNTDLINFKKYYFIAVAYGYNNFEAYDPDPDNPRGQAMPYLVGRSSATGAITPVVAIPSKPDPRFFGSAINSSFGDGLPITRIEGSGNGGNDLRLTQSSINKIMSGAPFKSDTLVYETGFGPLNVKVVDPLNVKATDFTLKFSNELDENDLYTGDFEDARWFLIDKQRPLDTIFSETSIRIANEQIIPEYGISVEIGQYQYEIANPGAESERLIPALLSSSVEYPSDIPWLTGVPDAEGFTFTNWIRAGTSTSDEDGGATGPCYLPDGGGAPTGPFWDDEVGQDDRQIYENVIDGTFSPAHLVFANNCGVGPFNQTAASQVRNNSSGRDLTDLSSVQVFITPDKSRWSRVPVFEMQHDPAFAQLGQASALLRNQVISAENSTKMFLRGALSVDKNGLNQTQVGANLDEITMGGRQIITQELVDQLREDLDDEVTLPDNTDVTEWEFILIEYDREYPELNLVERQNGELVYNHNNFVGLSIGMGWFPGFAINVETGERLNMAFGENSFFAPDNGRDMLWNPSQRLNSGPASIQQFFGGEHYFYVFDNNSLYKDELQGLDEEDILEYNSLYDDSQLAYTVFTTGNSGDRRDVYAGIEWVGFPLLQFGFDYLSPEEGLVPGEVIISANVATPYQPYATAADELGDGQFLSNQEGSLPYVPTNEAIELSDNQWYPMYEFSTTGSEAFTFQADIAEDALDLIDIVPNPYYAFSSYEQSRVDNRVKFVNLPPECKIQIFTVNGTLVRILEKDNPSTFLEWDLRNETFIPVAGGIYLIHVSVPGVGETVLKFFMATRPADLRNL